MSDKKLLHDIEELLKGGEDVYVRILTRQEMIDKGLMSNETERPSHWDSAGEMDDLFGANNIWVLDVVYDGNYEMISIVIDADDGHFWCIEPGYFELINDTPSEGNTKVTLDDIKDFINNKLNKG